MMPQPTKEFMANMIEFRREQFIETLADNEALLADGFEEALIGHTQGGNVVAVYDYELCVQVLMERDSMTAHEAIDFMDFNVVGSYVGDKTPVFISMA
tara:strand:+ start:1191 stop:1484 length:294 start_codon:yes stop_codon:yes gene_type:complete